MYPAQIQPRSTDIQPFGATGDPYDQKYLNYGILGLFWTPGDNFGGSKWHQQTILDVSHQDPTKIHWDPSLWSHLWPEMPGLWHFWAISDSPRDPRGQFWWVQLAQTDYPGCISPRSIHLEPPEPTMSRNACFMAFLGSLWP